MSLIYTITLEEIMKHKVNVKKEISQQLKKNQDGEKWFKKRDTKRENKGNKFLCDSFQMNYR